jgi:tight adherence protein C
MILALVGCFFLVLLAVAGAGYWFLQDPPKPKDDEDTPSVLIEPLAEQPKEKPVAAALATIGQRVPAAQVAAHPHAKKLQAAGYRHPSALAIFYGVKCVLAAALALGAAVLAGVQGQDLSSSLLAALALGGFAYLLPDRVLGIQIARRAQALRRALPPAIDLMVLGLEAGQPLDQVLADTSRELRGAYKELSAEFATVPLELRAGNSRMEVLRNLGHRNQDPELTKLVNLLIDGDRFGTSLAPALRNHARYLRTRRRQQVQEQARKTSVKLVFPVFFLIFPSVLLVTLGPAVLQMMTAFEQMAR